MKSILASLIIACCGTVASPAEAAQATMVADCRLMDRRGADVKIPCKVVTHNDKVISLNVTLKNKENYSRVFTQIKKLPGDQWLVKDDTGREWHGQGHQGGLTFKSQDYLYVVYYR